MTTQPDWWNNPPELDDEEARWAGTPSSTEIEAEAYKLRLRDAAKEKVAAEKAALVEMPAFDIGTLAELLQRPQEPPHRVEGLIPSEGGTLIVAMRKTGKTTLILNLVHSLLSGQPFLGRFRTRAVRGRVAILNFEVSAAQAARWADEVGVDPGRLVVVNLRGRRNPLGVPEDRGALAEQLQAFDVESVIVDPFGRAYTGASQNDAGEVGAWLAELDRWARADVGASDVILAAHAGWNGERTRGASALEDWADSIINITRSESDESVRYLKAMGRDVEVEEDQLEFDPATRRLTLTGFGGRQQQKTAKGAEDLRRQVVQIISDHAGFNGTQVEAKLRELRVTFSKGDERKALAAAVAAGVLRFDAGPNNQKLYFVRAEPPQASLSTPEGGPPSLPSPPLVGGREGGSPTGASPVGEVA
ncbi:AAA family ATPase [Solicola sp. PLA-1-18]|uniref:AAA family ATPase n=1 Tax=Solicola sp. PLA-1-18 TaxID=3380532 RepID=UPI003B7FFC1F